MLAARASADEIRIGMSAPFSGASRLLGIELYRGSMACFEEVNRAGGIHGRSIRLIAYDDAYEPEKTIENTIRLVEQDDVQLLYGYAGSATITRALPLLKLYENRHQSLFFPLAGSEAMHRPPYDRFVFNLRAPLSVEAAGLVDNFFRKGRRRIAVFYQVDAFGRSGWSGVRDALSGHGLRMACEATYHRHATYSTSMSEQVAHLRRSTPDAVICVATHSAAAAFIRDARDAGWDVPIAAVSRASYDSLFALLREAETASGKDYTSNVICAHTVPSYQNLDLPAVREYRALMEAHPPQLPHGLASEGYESLRYSCFGFEGFLDAKLVVEVLRRVGPNFDRRALRQAAESVKNFDLGISDPVSFGPNSHDGLRRVYYASVTDGQFLPVPGWR
jgi:ABC-type branched-subunit amino acid transport system substrate-binding protein